jgi:hypothetical protein
MDWVDLAQDEGKWLDLVNTIMNLRDAQKTEFRVYMSEQ